MLESRLVLPVFLLVALGRKLGENIVDVLHMRSCDEGQPSFR